MNKLPIEKKVHVVQFNNPASYLKLVANFITTNDSKVCIRENSRNAGNGFVNYNKSLSALLTNLNTKEEKTVLLIDLGFAEEQTYKMQTGLAFQTVAALNEPKAWNGIIVSSGSFPADLGVLDGPKDAYSAAVIHRLDRYESKIWKSLLAKPLPCKIHYGDFGTKHPYYMPAKYEGSASIKYTLEDIFLIYRGKKASEHKRQGKQYNDSAKRLIKSKEFSGKDFSWGDGRIYEIGNRDDKPGNSGSWVQISQNHHLSFLHSIL